MDFNPNKREARYLYIASQQSNNSMMKHKHGSVITIGGRLVSFGHNYHKKPESAFEKCHSIHAEIHALHKLLLSTKINKKNKKRCYIYVVRISSTGHYMNSKPCQNCVAELKENGIDKVIYSYCHNKFRIQKL